jgi:hypothetical protein
MAASQLRKSLPMIDTSAADQRREEREQQQRDSRRPQDQKGRNRNSVTLKLKPRKEGDTRPTSPPTSILQKLDGTKWLRMVSLDGKLTERQLDKYFVPTFIETKAGEGKSERPATPQKDATMKKSKLDSLIAHARKNPGKLQPQTLQALNQHLEKIGKPVISLPAPVPRWGVMPTVADIANNVQHAVSKTPAPSHAIPAPGRPMTTQELQEHRLQQARELEQRRIVEAKAAPKGAVVASWIGGGVVH